jgi:hypothetical protein
MPTAEKPAVDWSYVRYKMGKEYPITEQSWKEDHAWIVFGESEERGYELQWLDSISWKLTLTFERADEPDWVRKCIRTGPHQ